MFADKNYLLFLIALLPFALLLSYFLLKRKKDMGKLISKTNMPVLSNVNFTAYKVKNFMITAALIFLIIALARPQYGERETEIEKETSEIILAIDVSKSMLAEDIKPSRINKAKELLTSVIKENEGEKIGAIVFSGTAMWQCPMTYDSEALKMFLQNVGVGAIPVGGTRFNAPIDLAVKAVSGKKNSSKVLVLITDGEDYAEGTKQSLDNAKQAGLKIITVGIGTYQGAPIPERNEYGRTLNYVKDSGGKIVMSRLNSALLQSISKDTGGKYFEISGNSDISQAVINEIKGLDKNAQGKIRENTKQDRFQIFLAIALLFLLLWQIYPLTLKAGK